MLRNMRSLLLRHSSKQPRKRDVQVFSAARAGPSPPPPPTPRPSLAAALWIRYQAVLASHPILTKCATSAICGALGDVIAQSSSTMATVSSAAAEVAGAHGPFIAGNALLLPTASNLVAHLVSWDAWRTLRMAILGFATAPIGHFWYYYLDKNIHPAAPTTPRAIGTKLLLDQGFLSPLLHALFYVLLKSLEGRPDLIVATLQEKYLPTLQANYSIWPIALWISFRFVPTEQRILFNSLVGLFWSTVLSVIANRGGSGGGGGGL